MSPELARLDFMTDSKPTAYFQALGEDRYLPTIHAGGAWRDDELHLAPVAGLLIHHLEQWREAHSDGSMVYSRFTFEVLGQIGCQEISLTTEVIRPGRTIELVETTAVIGDRATIRARAWLLQRSDTSEVAAQNFESMPSLEECPDVSALLDWPGGYISSITAHQAPGHRAGRTRAWIGSDLDLVAGEPSQPLAEYCKFLDTANGIAVMAQPSEWMFPNVELTLHFFAEPTGRKVGLDTTVAFGSEGVGLTSTVMHDVNGPVGTIHQATTLRKIPQG